MANKKITEATNVYPTGLDKIPIGRATSTAAYNVTVGDLRSSVIDVHDYGAVGDGTTDDATAINLALAVGLAPAYGATRAGRIVIKLHPGKVYRITSPLNMCEMQGVVLDGGAPNFGATLLGQTDGAAMIEIIGSQDITIKNLNIYGSSTDDPAVGVFISRSDTVHGVNSYNIGFDNVEFGGYFNSAALYVVESESNYFRRVAFDTTGGTMTACALLCRANALSLTPVHATLNDDGNGLFNINFNGCTFSPQGDVRSLHLKDAAGSVYLHDSYLYSTTVPTIEVEGGAALHCDYVSCEGTPEKTIYLNYDAGAHTNTYGLYINRFGFGSPTGHSLYADDNVLLRNSYINSSPPGISGGAAMPVRLWVAENCDFTGLGAFAAGVFDILFDSATGYSYACKYKLERDDTITFSGGAYSLGDIVEDMCTNSAERLQVPGLKIGPASAATNATILIMRTATKTWDVGSLADGATASTYLAIPSILADGNWIAWASLDSLDEYGWQVTATPSDDGAVYVNVTNHSGGVIDPPSGTLRVVAMKVA